MSILQNRLLLGSILRLTLAKNRIAKKKVFERLVFPQTNGADTLGAKEGVDLKAIRQPKEKFSENVAYEGVNLLNASEDFKERKVEEASKVDMSKIRKLWLEVRGLPLVAWSKENLKILTKDIGQWENWENEKELLTRIECPIVCLYSDKINKVSVTKSVVIDNKLCKVGMEEGGQWIAPSRTQIDSGKSEGESPYTSSKGKGFSFVSRVSELECRKNSTKSLVQNRHKRQVGFQKM
ncbi:hypothetical protein POM88_001291 [Heracleum sosnowskyi]|uniref:DUF4283 domain-containing protein n=1 Tax=Heracleum sosnowskyi TaxID=360622 RepID=A0AAD8NAP2_9APIA|nr:hypothetical protein POM88_001291 [Heracleum sosnowskyi]